MDPTPSCSPVPGALTRPLLAAAVAVVVLANVVQSSHVVGASRLAWPSSLLMLLLVREACGGVPDRRGGSRVVAGWLVVGASVIGLGVHVLQPDHSLSWLSSWPTLLLSLTLAASMLDAGRWPVARGRATVAVVLASTLFLLAHLFGVPALFAPGSVGATSGVSVGAAAGLLLVALAWLTRDVEVADPYARAFLVALPLAGVAIVATRLWLQAVDAPAEVALTITVFVSLVAPSTAGAVAVNRGRRQTRALHEVRRALLTQTSYAMLLVDDGGAIIEVNDSACDLLQRTEHDLVGTSVDDLVPSSIRGHHAGWRQEYGRELRARRMTERGDLDIERADGTTVQVRIALTPIPQVDGPPMIAASLVDVTALAAKARLAEARADSLESTLRREMATLAALRDLDQAKDLLLTAISHEIRTPLTVLIGMTELMTNPAYDLSPDVEQRMHERIHVQARKLHSLVEDLLDLDRFQHGSLAPRAEDVRVDVIARDAADEAATAFARRIVVDVPPLRAHLDPRHLERVLANLLGNACKYASTGPIHVEAEAVAGGERVLIAVEDEGEGISPSRRHLIFDPFERGDRVDSARPGVGIGLALVKRLVEANGGTTWVEAGPRAGGARFLVELPLSAATTAPVMPVPPPARPEIAAG